MSEREEFASWIPLQAALSWVATRDANLLEEAIRRPGALHDLDEWDQRATISSRAKEADAWALLRAAIESRTVKAKGVPYRERMAVPIQCEKTLARYPILELDSEEDVEEEDEAELPNNPLPAAEVGTLVLGDRAGVLQPSDWALVGGQGWNNVVISRSDLARAFPHGKTASFHRTGKTVFKSQNRRYLSDAVEAVILRHWPNGFPDGIGASERNRQINLKVADEIEAMVRNGKFADLPAMQIKRKASSQVIGKVLTKLTRSRRV